jgi:hypothetical protein
MAGSVKIDGTKFGEITINGKPYDSDMTVYWDGRVVFRSKEHVIELGEFLKIMKSSPEVVVFGTGQEGVIRITPEVIQLAEERKVTVYSEKTPKAAEMFNAFVADGKKVVGVFHVTC